MGRAQFRLSSHLLADLLNLPDETEIWILGVEQGGRELLLLAESPGLPDVDKHEPVPECQPGFRSIYKTILRFEDWNVRE